MANIVIQNRLMAPLPLQFTHGNFFEYFKSFRLWVTDQSRFKLKVFLNLITTSTLQVSASRGYQMYAWYARISNIRAKQMLDLRILLRFSFQIFIGNSVTFTLPNLKSIHTYLHISQLTVDLGKSYRNFLTITNFYKFWANS